MVMALDVAVFAQVFVNKII